MSVFHEQRSIWPTSVMHDMNEYTVDDMIHENYQIKQKHVLKLGVNKESTITYRYWFTQKLYARWEKQLLTDPMK